MSPVHATPHTKQKALYINKLKNLLQYYEKDCYVIYEALLKEYFIFSFTYNLKSAASNTIIMYYNEDNERVSALYKHVC